MPKKHKEKINETKIHFISFLSLLIGFSESLLTYVNSAYFKSSLGSENVSMLYFFSYAIVLIGLLNMHKIVKKFGKATAFFFFFFMQVCSVTFLIFVQPSVIGILLLMAYLVFANLVIVLLDIILESYSEDRKSGRIRGFHLMIVNIGFLLGPFLSTRILERYDFGGLFFASMVLGMIIFVIGLLGLRGGNNKFEGDLTVKDLVKKIFVNKDLMRIYWISFVLEFFYALMVVYTPLYLLDLGLGWDVIGVVFTIMLLPFVMFGYMAGLIADKKLGEKEMIIGALVVMALSTASIFFISSPAAALWAGVLFLTRTGATFIETLRDSYFYKRIDGRDMDVISFFRTSRSAAYLVATALSAILLVVFPVKAIFLFVAVVVALALYPAMTLVDNKCESEMVCKPVRVRALKR